jgi:hypothetical protein
LNFLFGNEFAIITPNPTLNTQHQTPKDDLRNDVIEGAIETFTKFREWMMV